MSSPTFQRTIEDFVCEHCGKKVKGDGYTDHCPYCLWSKHVDINPGDRQAKCKGMLEPISYDATKKEIHYKCTICNHTWRVKPAKNDNREKLIELSTMPL